MTKLRPEQKRGPATKLTREVLREKPWLASIIRARIKELKSLRAAKKASELDLD